MSAANSNFTEQDIEELLLNRRFVAAAHAYSMGKFPLGEAVVRAKAGNPFVPTTLTGSAYQQLLQEVAERISSQKIAVPQDLATEFPDVYADYQGPSHVRAPYIGAAAHSFSQLLSAEAKKIVFGLRRESFDEKDIEKILSDEKILACIDAYREGLMTFGEAKKLMFDDETYMPFDLSWRAFHDLCVEIIERIQNQKITLPPNLREKFPDIYSVRGSQ